MNDPAPTTPPQDDHAPDTLEQRTIAWLFGDDEQDPGLIADEAARRADFGAWLDALAKDYGALKRSLAPSGSKLALTRLDALREDIARRRASPIDWSDARTDNVRSFAAARARGARPARAWRNVAIGVLVAAAAVILFVLTSGKPVRDVDASVARLLLKDMPADDGMGFAGAAAPTAHDRGFLLGAVIDLSRAKKSQSAEPDLSLARQLADRAQIGLAAPDDAEARRQRAVGGCAAILVDPTERAACEKGLADYIARRDAYFSDR